MSGKNICIMTVILIISVMVSFAGCGPETQQVVQEHPSASDSLSAENISVGEHIYFGSYPQSWEAGEQTEKKDYEPIEWRVLDIKDGRALLISEKLLDTGEYNDSHVNITWEKCSLRRWLNFEFMTEAFSPDEIDRIALVTNKNPNNPVLFTEGGAKTEDRIFLLSIKEAKRYFRDDEERAAFPTDYASGHGGTAPDVIWWLRSPGGIGNHAAYVTTEGRINSMGYTIGGRIYIRPALWMEIQQG